MGTEPAHFLGCQLLWFLFHFLFSPSSVLMHWSRLTYSKFKWEFLILSFLFFCPLFHFPLGFCNIFKWWRLFSTLNGDWIQVSQRRHFGRIEDLTYEWRLPTVASLPPVIKLDQNILLLFFFVVLRFDPGVSCVLQKHSAIELRCCPLLHFTSGLGSYWPWPHCDSGRPLACNLLAPVFQGAGITNLFS